MDDDFFKDLVPIKASPAQRSVSNNVETSSIFSDDVLSAVPDTRPAAEPNQKGSNDTFPHPMTSPMGDPKQKKEVREMEKAMQAMLESTFKRFAGGLQKVLEDVQQRLESLEGQTSRIAEQLQELSEIRTAEEGTDAQRFDALFSSLRDVQRGVQVVRDKQELIEAQAELAKLAPLKKQERAEEVLAKPEAAKAPEEAAQAPKPAEVAPPAPPAPAAPAPPAAAPAVAPPAAVVPPAAPAAPPLPTAPQQQETQFGGQTAQQPQHLPPSLPAYSAGPQMPSMLSTPFVPSMPGFQGDRPTGAPGYAPPPPPPPPPQQQQQHHPGEPPLQNPFSGAPPPPQPYPQAPPPPPQFPGPPEALQHMQYSQAPPPQAGSQYEGYSQSPRPATPQAAPYFRPPPPHMSRMDSYGPPPPQPAPPSFGRTSAGYPTFSRPPPDAPPPPQQGSGGYGGPPAPQQRPPAQQPSQPSAAPSTRSVPLEKVIDDVSSMGFSRHEVHGVISDLMDNGQSVDLNVVLDRLMRARG